MICVDIHVLGICQTVRNCHRVQVIVDCKHGTVNNLGGGCSNFNGYTAHTLNHSFEFYEGLGLEYHQ